MRSVAAKVGCTAGTLRQRMRQDERGRASRGAEERARLKALEREKRELRQANECPASEPMGRAEVMSNARFAGIS